MRSLKLFLYGVIFIALNSFADSELMRPNSADDIIHRMAEHTVVTGKVQQQKTLHGINKTLKSSGHFIFWRGQGIYLATEKPFPNALTLSPKGIINWLPNGSGALAQEQSGIIQKEINKTLLAFLSADIHALDQRFSADWSIAQHHWQLTLTPKLAMIADHLKQVRIDGDLFMNHLIVEATNGDVTELYFSEQLNSEKISADECRWFSLPSSNQNLQCSP